MPVRMVVAVTDRAWFDTLRALPGIEEVNFWAPSERPFRALAPGELFLFKLHSPDDAIVGGGVFAYANSLPLSLAWDAFGIANGAASFAEMRQRIVKYRKDVAPSGAELQIGCRILTQPFFLPESAWIELPLSWRKNIVSFRGYSTSNAEGLALWEAVQDALEFSVRGIGLREPAARYGEPALVRPRLGQGAFRVLVTDVYSRRCAVTGERVLPALDAAHIRPFALGGEHAASNGILMRRDIHSIFDAGFVTITPDYRFEVGRRLREEYENGRHYYALHGSPVAVPERIQLRPDTSALRWHNDTLFRG